MLGEEKFLLQGMPEKAQWQTAGPTHLLHSLSGNSWNFFNFVPAMIAALAALPVAWLSD